MCMITPYLFLLYELFDRCNQTTLSDSDGEENEEDWEGSINET